MHTVRNLQRFIDFAFQPPLSLSEIELRLYYLLHHLISSFSLSCFLVQQSDIGAVLTQLEKLTLIIACLCHDIDHRGTNNAFQKK